jgi:hypothetical protein
MNSLDDVYKRIADVYNVRKSLNIHVQQSLFDVATKNILFTELSSAKFMIPEALDYVQKCTKTTIVWSGRVSIHVMTYKDADIPSLVLLKRIVRRILTTLEVLNINRSNIFKYWLVPCDKNRQFPSSSTGIFLPKHINGGYTYLHPSLEGSNTTANIYIYRLEEFPKVMLHETIHHSKIDISGIHNSTQMQLLLERIKHICHIHPSTIFLPNEAIVETWALIFQISFVSLDYSLPYAKILGKEREWSDKLSSRLLLHQFSSCYALKAPSVRVGLF